MQGITDDIDGGLRTDGLAAAATHRVRVWPLGAVPFITQMIPMFSCTGRVMSAP